MGRVGDDWRQSRKTRSLSLRRRRRTFGPAISYTDERRTAMRIRRGECMCQHFVTGRLHINIVRDEEDESQVLEVTSRGFPRRTAVTPHLVVKLCAQVPWMAEDRKNGGFVVRTTSPPAEHAYKQVGFCIPCGLKLMEYEGMG